MALNEILHFRKLCAIPGAACRKIGVTGSRFQMGKKAFPPRTSRFWPELFKGLGVDINTLFVETPMNLRRFPLQR